MPESSSKPLDVVGQEQTLQQHPDTNDLPMESASSAKKRWKIVGAGVLVLTILAGVFFPRWLDHLQEAKEREYKTRCKVLAAKTDWDALESLSKEWAEWNPSSNDALMFRAEAALQLSQPEATVEYLAQLQDTYHGTLQALAIRGDILLSDLSRVSEAVENWKRMLRINEKVPVAHQRLIYVYAMTLQRKKLVEQIHQAIELGCEPPEAYSYLLMSNVLNFSDGLTVLTRWRLGAPEETTLEVAQAVYAAKQTADREMATFGTQTIMPGDQRLLETCLKKYPTHPEVLSLKIEQALFEGDDQAVARWLGQCGPESEKDGRFWRYRGWLLDKRGRTQQAAESLKRALELNPFEWQARHVLADVYRKLNQPEQADRQAQIAALGKTLQEQLFEQPTARSLNPELAGSICEYLKMLNLPQISQALEQRL